MCGICIVKQTRHQIRFFLRFVQRRYARIHPLGLRVSLGMHCIPGRILLNFAQTREQLRKHIVLLGKGVCRLSGLCCGEIILLLCQLQGLFGCAGKRRHIHRLFLRFKRLRHGFRRLRERHGGLFVRRIQTDAELIHQPFQILFVLFRGSNTGFPHNAVNIVLTAAGNIVQFLF